MSCCYKIPMVRDGRVVVLSSFNVFGVCKQGKIAVHRDLDGTLFMPDLSSLNSAVLGVSFGDRQIIFVSAYHPGRPRHNDSNEIVVDELVRVVQLYEGSCIIGGDTNAYNYTWGSHVDDSRRHFLLESMLQVDMTVLNN